MVGGLGLISSSNFYVPQVNLPGSMASFVMRPEFRFSGTGDRAGSGGGAAGPGYARGL